MISGSKALLAAFLLAAAPLTAAAAQRQAPANKMSIRAAGARAFVSHKMRTWSRGLRSILFGKAGPQSRPAAAEAGKAAAGRLETGENEVSLPSRGENHKDAQRAEPALEAARGLAARGTDAGIEFDGALAEKRAEGGLDLSGLGSSSQAPNQLKPASPRGDPSQRREPPPPQSDGHEILEAIENAPLTRRHYGFIAALLAALAFDAMKPATLGFVMPGMKEMFDLTPTAASYLAVSGLTGTMLGSLVWGHLGDRIGRRRGLLYTVAIFSVASLCGAAMEYWQSLAACFIMGFGVGGEVPLVYALATEYIPAKHRGKLILALGTIGLTAGYALAAGVAAVSNLLIGSMDAWRAMWLFQLLPAALVLVIRSRVVPESARFLIKKGRIEEARRQAASIVGPIASEPARPAPPVVHPKAQAIGRALALSFFSFAWGLANYGLLTWLPTLLSQLGLSAATSSVYLALSAVLALPAIAITVGLFTRWSTKGTIVLYAAAAAGALVAIGAVLHSAASAPVLIGLIGAAMLFFLSLGGAFPLYAAELFPTATRGRDTGIVQAAGRVGAILGPFLGGVWMTAGGSVLAMSAVLALILGAAGLAIGIAGIETRGKSLEELE